MISGSLPWSQRNFVKLMTYMHQDPKTFSSTIPNDLQLLLSKMLHSNPLSRPLISNINSDLLIFFNKYQDSNTKSKKVIRGTSKIFFPTTDLKNISIPYRIQTSQSFGSKLELTKVARQTRSLDFTNSPFFSILNRN